MLVISLNKLLTDVLRNSRFISNHTSACGGTFFSNVPVTITSEKRLSGIEGMELISDEDGKFTYQVQITSERTFTLIGR